jgi:hypothetical protein
LRYMTSEIPGETSDEDLVCELCGQKFDTLESLNDHKVLEKKEESLKYKGVD